ncbi:MAG: excinuclease ATPase subunit [Firmicutes bacterium]|nr:excinuclease ATPase subunit [Bacillota bacterium]
MTWGVSFMYYHCPDCEMKFKYALDLLQEFEESFGKCPFCGIMGEYEYDGPRRKDDADYLEVE